MTIRMTTYNDIHPYTITELCKRQLLEIGGPAKSEDQAKWFGQLKELRSWLAGCEINELIPNNVLETMTELLEQEIKMAQALSEEWSSDGDSELAEDTLADIAEYQMILNEL